MKKQQEPLQEKPTRFPRLQPHYQKGLTAEEVRLRAVAGASNVMPEGITPSIPKIILKNLITPFNIINLLLALAVVLVGHPRNALFFLIAVINTLMGIFQELRAKHTLDKLSILARGTVKVVRDGGTMAIPQEEVVLDDILLLETGNQVCADAVVVVAEGLEMDESLLTGEGDSIRKAEGDAVLSGSHVVAGRACARVTAVGKGSYAGKLSVQAKQEKKQSAPLMRTLNTIIRVLALAIIPVGLLLFYTQYTMSQDLAASVLGATAAMVGMIPEGLILLTGVTLTLGAVKLARRGALVQALPSIETLARSDVLCLDKTGTITDGTLSLELTLPQQGYTEEEMALALAEMMAALKDDNATARALRKAYPLGAPPLPAEGVQGPEGAGEGAGQPAAALEPVWETTSRVPFSSRRKWCGCGFGRQGSYVLGAPGFVFPGDGAGCAETVQQYAVQGFRVLCLAHTDAPFPDEGLPQGLALVGLVVLSDTVRAEAPATFRFFEEEGVTLKVISGDDALTVSTIATKAGITGAGDYLDLSLLGDDADYNDLVDRYTVFGRVSPEQKKRLVTALKENGHTVCMTGDGVNDVLAMKESNCGVAMLSGSEAARGASDFVLMTSDFSSMVDVLKEGRQVINNIENVASLYLVKTIYSTLLALLYVFIPYPYPFAPLQMTPINALTVGVPSFFMALRANHEKPKGRFLLNVLENSVPAALSVVFNILVIQLAGIAFGLTQLETSTMNVLLTGVVGFRLLVHVAWPLRKPDIALVSALGVCFLGAMLVFATFFGYGSLFTRNAFFYVPLLYFGPMLFHRLTNLVHRMDMRFGKGKKT